MEELELFDMEVSEETDTNVNNDTNVISESSDTETVENGSGSSVTNIYETYEYNIDTTQIETLLVDIKNQNEKIISTNESILAHNSLALTLFVVVGVLMLFYKFLSFFTKI